MPLVRPFETFFEDGAGPAGYHGAHHEAFVVAGKVLMTGFFFFLLERVGGAYKLDMMTWKPACSGPRMFRLGTLTLLNSM